MTEQNGLKNIKEEKIIIDPIINVFHVGGRGDMGLVENLLKLRDSLSFSIFEADIESGDNAWADYDKLIKYYAYRYGVKLSIIPKCLSNSISRKEFHINVMPDCSSLLKINPRAKNYTRMDRGKYRIIWGEICQPNRTIEINTTTLDKLYANNEVQAPHFLSLDVQGAEYEILEGASNILQGDVLGVISEVEFREMYNGQKLFIDQYALLRKHQFNLFELYNLEHWHSSIIVGKGALMVAEALFLRDFQYFIEKRQAPSLLLSNLSKLATIALYFKRDSYAFEIVEYIMKNLHSEWNIFIKQNDNKYLQELREFYQKTKIIQLEIEKIPTYSEFIKGNKLTSRPKLIIIFIDILKLFKKILDKLEQKIKEKYNL